MDKFTCHRCGSCCRLIGLWVPFMAPIYKAVFLPKPDNSCRFLEKDGDEYKCSIYDQRPTVCRVDKMAKVLGISEEKARELNATSCESLRALLAERE